MVAPSVREACGNIDEDEKEMKYKTKTMPIIVHILFKISFPTL